MKAPTSEAQEVSEYHNLRETLHQSPYYALIYELLALCL